MSKSSHSPELEGGLRLLTSVCLTPATTARGRGCGQWSIAPSDVRSRIDSYPAAVGLTATGVASTTALLSSATGLAAGAVGASAGGTNCSVDGVGVGLTVEE